MSICRVCGQDLDNSRFSVIRRKLKSGIEREYLDTTCMVCRRTKYLSKPGKKEIHRAGTKRWREENPEQYRRHGLKKYGITIEDYDKKRKEQDFSCAICGIREEYAQQGKAKCTENALHVDHNHDTGEVRDLLCINCNNLIGKAKEDEVILSKAILYLRKWRIGVSHGNY